MRRGLQVSCRSRQGSSVSRTANQTNRKTLGFWPTMWPYVHKRPVDRWKASESVFFERNLAVSLVCWLRKKCPVSP